MSVLTLANIKSEKHVIEKIAARYGISNLRIFGSVANGNADEVSDIDLLIDMEAGRSLFDIVAFQQEAEKIWGKTVDVVEASALRNPLRRKYILANAIPL